MISPFTGDTAYVLTVDFRTPSTYTAADPRLLAWGMIRATSTPLMSAGVWVRKVTLAFLAVVQRVVPPMRRRND